MTKTTSLAGIIPLMMVCTSPALAQTYYGDYGLYLAAGVSRVNASFENANNVTVEDSDSTASIRIGWMFPNQQPLNGLFGLEIGYLDLGSYSSGRVGRNNEVDITADGFTVGGVASFRAAQQVEIYGRLGAYFVDTDSTSVVDGRRVSNTDGGTEMYFAIGAEVDTGDWNFFGEYAKVDAGGRNLEADVMSFGIKYEFKPPVQ